MNILKKVIFIIIYIIAFLFILYPNYVRAGDNETTIIVDDTFDPGLYKPNPIQSGGGGYIEDYGERMAGFIQIVGTIVSVGTLMVIGIRYMVCSVEEKAEYKERLLPYFIGAMLVFAASNLVNIIYKMFYYNN